MMTRFKTEDEVNKHIEDVIRRHPKIKMKEDFLDDAREIHRILKGLEEPHEEWGKIIRDLRVSLAREAGASDEDVAGYRKVKRLLAPRDMIMNTSREIEGDVFKTLVDTDYDDLCDYLDQTKGLWDSIQNQRTLLDDIETFGGPLTNDIKKVKDILKPKKFPYESEIRRLLSKRVDELGIPRYNPIKLGRGGEDWAHFTHLDHRKFKVGVHTRQTKGTKSTGEVLKEQKLAPTAEESLDLAPIYDDIFKDRGTIDRLPHDSPRIIARLQNKSEGDVGGLISAGKLEGDDDEGNDVEELGESEDNSDGEVNLVE